MEHRRVRRVDLVFAVNPAGGKNADGRLLLLHDADLQGLVCVRSRTESSSSK